MPIRTISVQTLMESSGVTFGTSGARGLAVAMTDEVCYAYTRAFMQYLDSNMSVQFRLVGLIDGGHAPHANL